jgi:rfaE bifunctional protein kinase chain/domain
MRNSNGEKSNYFHELNKMYLGLRAHPKNLQNNSKLEMLSQHLDFLKDIKVLIIGDTVIDRYTSVTPRGRATKDPILSSEFEFEEDYAGGVLAVANHVSSYVDKIKLVTLIGDQNPQLKFIKGALSNNIELKTFTKKNSPTTIKQRYIDYKRNNKLFKVDYISNKPITKRLSNTITDFLSQELPKYNMVVVLDYNHGFIDDSIKNALQTKSKFLALNVQSNSSNLGYNYVTRYTHADFITMDEEELRLPLMMKFEEIEDVVLNFHKKFKHNKFLITRGPNGCLFFNQGKTSRGHVLTNKVVDTIGAGDAVFAVTSLLAYSDLNSEMIPFIANCVGGIGANIIGNKEFVTKDKLLNFIGELDNGLE